MYCVTLVMIVFCANDLSTALAYH